MTAIIRRLITGTIVPETIRAVEGGTAGRVANFKLSKIYENPDPNFKKLSYRSSHLNSMEALKNAHQTK